MAGRFFDDNTPLVVAHRGLALEHPENTLPAFEAALQHGADILETDAHVTADKVAVLSHDPGLSRTAGRNGLIETFSWEKLQAIDLGGAHIPTLREALHTFPDVRFSVDVKHPKAVEPVVSAIIDAKAIDRVIIGSFSSRRRKAAIARLAGVATLGGYPETLNSYVAAALRRQHTSTRALRAVDALFLPPRAYGLDLFTPWYIDAVRESGVALGVWVVNEPQHMLDYWRRGVHAIVTDRTDLAVAARDTLN